MHWLAPDIVIETCLPGPSRCFIPNLYLPRSALSLYIVHDMLEWTIMETYPRAVLDDHIRTCRIVLISPPNTLKMTCKIFTVRV